MPDTAKERPILIVEDHSDTLDSYRIELEQAGHSVLAFTSAEEALPVIEKLTEGERPSIAIVDGILAQGKNGWLLAEDLKALIPNIVITMVTGWGTVSANKVRAQKLGIAAIYTKPVAIAVIVNTLLQQQEKTEAIEPANDQQSPSSAALKAPARSTQFAFMIIGFAILFYIMVWLMMIGLAGVSAVAYHFHTVEQIAHERELKQANADEDKRFLGLQHNLERDQDKALETIRQEVHDQRESLNGLWEHNRAVREALATHGLMNNLKKGGNK